MIRVISGCQNSVLPVKINKNFKLLSLIISVRIMFQSMSGMCSKKVHDWHKIGSKILPFFCFEIMRSTHVKSCKGKAQLGQSKKVDDK